MGGQFTDRAQRTPEAQLRWYREQTVNGQPVHLAHRLDDILLISYPKQGMSFSVQVQTPSEMAEALLMILTYPSRNAAGSQDDSTRGLFCAAQPNAAQHCRG